MVKTKLQTFPGSALMGTIIAITSSTSFSQCHTSHDSSMISSITLDDSLRSSERFQYRHDPRLASLKEQKWAANSWGNLEEEELRLAPYGQNSKNCVVFSSSIIDDALLEGTTTVDTALCAKPERKPSIMRKSSSSASLNYHHLLSSCSLSAGDDYQSSKNFALAANFFLEEEILNIDYFDVDNDYETETASPAPSGVPR